MDLLNGNAGKNFPDASPAEIDAAARLAGQAFKTYRSLSFKQRANFLRAIAAEVEALGDELIQVARAETHLSEERLRKERTRTLFQLRSYALACERGVHLDLRINTSDGVKPDLRKTMVPLGPVLVFGAANFPFAYSTAGGDTACALAAGNPVIVKAHPGHAYTSKLVASAVLKAGSLFHLPEGVFSHLFGASTEVGRALVEHPSVKAVGFTGSFAGGTQLAEWAAARRLPIPVFAEMSSINPVFLLPEKIKSGPAELATMLAASITMDAGQFCTNPGLLVALDTEELSGFVAELSKRISADPPLEMLNPGIYKNYIEKRGNALSQPGVSIQALAGGEPALYQSIATIAVTSANEFIRNPLMQQEVFGPFSLLVTCADPAEILQVAEALEGQLTSTLIAEPHELDSYPDLVQTLLYNCGRFILNGVPTGVEVNLAMHHGGPFPATTDSRFTSVGADGLKRFVRPVTYQNWPNELLPPELRDENEGGFARMVNGRLDSGSIVR